MVVVSYIVSFFVFQSFSQIDKSKKLNLALKYCNEIVKLDSIIVYSDQDSVIGNLDTCWEKISNKESEYKFLIYNSKLALDRFLFIAKLDRLLCYDTTLIIIHHFKAMIKKSYYSISYANCYGTNGYHSSSLFDLKRREYFPNFRKTKFKCKINKLR